MTFADDIAKQTNGNLSMSGNVKILLCPGLVNLLVLEGIFLLLVLWISLCLWASAFFNVGAEVAGLVAGLLLVSMLRQQNPF